MPTYMSLCRWTQQGALAVKQSPARLDAARRTLEGMGVRIQQFYMTTGRYDFVVIIEAADDQTLATALLVLIGAGNFHSETLRAFTEQEYRDILGRLPS